MIIAAVGTARISERMSCEEAAIFLSNIAHIPHIKQNHSIFLLLQQKIGSEKNAMRSNLYYYLFIIAFMNHVQIKNKKNV